MRAPRGRVLAAFAAVYLIWGSTYLAMKYAIASIPPFVMTGARFVIAGAVLYAWARAHEGCRPTGANWRTAAISGTLLVLGGTALVAWAEEWVPSGITALLVGTVPLWIVLLQWVGPARRRPAGSTIAGVVLGFAGFAVLVGPDVGRAGDLGGALPAGMLLLSSLLWAAGSLYSRRAPLPSPPALGMGMEMLAGGAICIAVGLLLGEGRGLSLAAVSARSVVALAYLIVFGSLVGFTCYLWLLRVSTPSRVATHVFVNPIVALFLGWAIAEERVTSRAVLAATIIVIAVVLVIGQKSLATDD